MPDEARDVTRRWFETWNRGDLDAFIDLYAADAEVTLPASWVETGTLEGRPAIRRFFEGLKESWEGHDEAVLRELFRAGDSVISRMDWQVRGRVSGIETHIDVTNVNTIEGGKIVRQRHYLDHDDALRDLGLAGG
jgi:ketosteroid isomerase-like protein